MFVFGSILTDRFNEDSDVDMVVDFDNEMLRQRAVERNVEALLSDIKQQPAAALVYPTTEWQPVAARIDPGRMYSYLRR